MSRNIASSEEQEVISGLLGDIEEKKDVTVLRAKDYGSRARGLESENSDYDVFFVFMQELPDYLVGSTYTDVIERSYDPEDTDLGKEIELHGWNLRKFIGGSDLQGHADGLIGSNPMAIEFIASNTVYYTDKGAVHNMGDWYDMETHVAKNFKPFALMKHYGSLAEGNYQKYIAGDWKIKQGVGKEELLDVLHESDRIYTNDFWLINEQETGFDEAKIGDHEIFRIIGEKTKEKHHALSMEEAVEHDLVERTTQDVTIKRYLNVIQALLKRRYVAETHEVPPMDFSDLLRACSDMMSTRVYSHAGSLMASKVQGRGHIEPSEPRQEFLNEWIEDEIDHKYEPEGHVERTPDVSHIRSKVEQMFDHV